VRTKRDSEHDIMAAGISNEKLMEMETVKIAIAMASHIRYKGQVAKLRGAVDSLLKQRKTSDVLLSISFANDAYKREFHEMQRKHPKIKIFVSEKHKFQMEHLHALSKHFKEYSLILFCDDDDMYHPLRTFRFADAYLAEMSRLQKGEKLVGVKEMKWCRHTHTGCSTPIASEFWCYGVIPSVIETFFARIKDDFDLLKHPFADIIFREYFRRIDPKNRWATIQTAPLYQYQHHANSVTQRTKNEAMRDPKIGVRHEMFSGAIAPCTDARCCLSKSARVRRLAQHTPYQTVEQLENIFPEEEYVKVVMQFLCDIPFECPGN